MTRKEKINRLKELSKENAEVQDLFDIVNLYYPILLDNPNEATPNMINGYNRLVKSNISDIEIQNELLL